MMHANPKGNILLFGLLLFSLTSHASSPPVIGKIYPIQETDLLELIHQRLAHLTQEGQLAAWQQQIAKRVEKHIDRPRPVAGITRATHQRTYSFDPTIIIPYDIKDAADKIIIKAGTRINPLERIPLTKTLVFYNGDDEKQITLVKEYQQQAKQPLKLILIKGSIKEQYKHFQQNIYFDQFGKLIQHFGIQHVPASITQQGKKLLITEVAL